MTIAQNSARAEPSTLAERYQALIERLRTAEVRFGRPEGSTYLVAVSKTHPAQSVRELAGFGQMDFGENQVQDALSKMDQLADLKCSWHFLGPIQSNKCRDIATKFCWVHSIDRLKIAARLSTLRPESAPPLKAFLQVNLQNEPTKTGITLEQAENLAATINKLPKLQLQGLMVLPKPELDFNRQRVVFARLRELQAQLNQSLNLSLDCLSMGMTNDLEAAVAEGATHVRIGTAIFGPRQVS